MKNEACGLCNSVEHTHLYSQIDMYQQSVTLVVCNDCGLRQLKPRMSERELDSFYNSEYYRLYSMDEKKATLPRWVKRKRAIASGILDAVETHHSLKSQKLLDVGCGHGFLLEDALSRGAVAYGQEPSTQQAEYLRRAGFEIYSSSIQDLADSRPHEFDAVTLSHVLEHIRDPHTFLGYIRSLLKPEGLLCVEVPNTNWQTKHGRHPLSIHSAHLYYYCRTTLNAILSLGGFQVVSTSYGLAGGSTRAVCTPGRAKKLSEMQLPLRDPHTILAETRAALSRLNPPLYLRICRRAKRDSLRVWPHLISAVKSAN